MNQPSRCPPRGTPGPTSSHRGRTLALLGVGLVAAGVGLWTRHAAPPTPTGKLAAPDLRAEAVPGPTSEQLPTPAHDPESQDPSVTSQTVVSLRAAPRPIVVSGVRDKDEKATTKDKSRNGPQDFLQLGQRRESGDGIDR